MIKRLSLHLQEVSDRLARLSREHALFPWDRQSRSERHSQRAEAVLAGIAAAVEWKRDQDIAEEAARQQATEAAEQRAAAEEIERNQSAEMMAGAFAELRIAIETDPQAAERDMLASIERLGIQPSAPGTGSLMSGFNSDPAFSSDEALASFDMDASINATIVSHEAEHQPGEEEVPAVDRRPQSVVGRQPSVVSTSPYSVDRSHRPVVNSQYSVLRSQSQKSVSSP